MYLCVCSVLVIIKINVNFIFNFTKKSTVKHPHTIHTLTFLLIYYYYITCWSWTWLNNFYLKYSMNNLFDDHVYFNDNFRTIWREEKRPKRKDHNTILYWMVVNDMHVQLSYQMRSSASFVLLCSINLVWLSSCHVNWCAEETVRSSELLFKPIH